MQTYNAAPHHASKLIVIHRPWVTWIQLVA